MKALFHIDDGSRWGLTLGNAANMLQYGAETSAAFTIEILANGPAVRELAADRAGPAGLLGQLTALAPSLRICACKNALNANGVSPESLLPFVQVVPAGVVELVLRQEEGYSYIKP